MRLDGCHRCGGLLEHRHGRADRAQHLLAFQGEIGDRGLDQAIVFQFKEYQTALDLPGGHQQQNWDAHNGVEENLRVYCPEIDQPVAGLLSDLAQRGMLDETLVIWGTRRRSTGTTSATSMPRPCT